MDETQEQWHYPWCFDCHDENTPAKLEQDVRYLENRTVYTCPQCGAEYNLRVDKRYTVTRIND